jgi:hypothetical protein
VGCLDRCRQLHEETLDATRVLPSKHSYMLDIIIAEEKLSAADMDLRCVVIMGSMEVSFTRGLALSKSSPMVSRLVRFQNWSGRLNGTSLIAWLG